MKRMHSNGLLVCAGMTTMLAAGSALAGTITEFTITDNGWTYYEENLIGGRTTSSAGFADFFYTDGPDHMYQNWWWYRGAGDTREYALSNQVDGGAAGNAAQLTYREPVGNIQDAVEITLTYSLNGLGPDAAILQVDWAVTNLTGNRLGFDWFAYMDVDLNGTAGADRGELLAFSSDGGAMQVTEDGSASVMNLRADVVGGNDLVGWEIGAFASIRNDLTNVSVDNLSNSGSPFGPGDFSGAYQHRMLLDGFDSAYGTLYKEFKVPAPGTLALLLLGAGLNPRKRRR